MIETDFIKFVKKGEGRGMRTEEEVWEMMNTLVGIDDNFEARDDVQMGSYVACKLAMNVIMWVLGYEDEIMNPAIDKALADIDKALEKCEGVETVKK